MQTSTPRRNALAPFQILCLIGFATLFSSYLRIPVLPLFAKSLGAGPAQIGMINGSFMLAAGLFSVPFGLLTDWVGSKPLIIAGVLAIAASSLLVTQCHYPSQMAAVYILFGLGLAAFAPGMLSLVADVMPPYRLGQAYGWYTTATYMAMTLGPATGGYLAKGIGLADVFLVSGLLLAAVAVQAFFLLPAGSPRQRIELPVMLAAGSDLLKNRWLLACLLAAMGSCIGFGFFLTFLPLYTASLGHDPGKTGLVFAAQALSNVVFRVPIGTVADRIDRRWLVVCGLACLATALTLMGQVGRIPLLVFVAAALGIGMALTYTAIGALIAEHVPAVQRGLAMGMYNSCIYLGMMAGSAGMGVALKTISYSLGFAIAGGIALLTLIWFVRMTVFNRHSPDINGQA